MDAHVLINLFHIFLVVPFLVWVGISRGSLPPAIFTTLIVLGIVVTLYHAFKAYIRWTSNSNFVWVNLIHALWVGPLLFYIGINKEKTQRPAYELLLLTAFGALGYHLYELAAYSDFL